MSNQNCLLLIIFFIFIIYTKSSCAMQRYSWTQTVLISSAIATVVGIIAKIAWDASINAQMYDQRMGKIQVNLTKMIFAIMTQIIENIKIMLVCADVHINEELVMKLEEDEEFYNRLQEEMIVGRSTAVLHSAARVLWQQRELLDSIKNVGTHDQFVRFDNELYLTWRRIVTSTEFWLEKSAINRAGFSGVGERKLIIPVQMISAASSLPDTLSSTAFGKITEKFG